MIDDDIQFYVDLVERYKAQAKAALTLAEEWRELYMQQLSIQNARTLNNVLIQSVETRGQA